MEKTLAWIVLGVLSGILSRLPLTRGFRFVPAHPLVRRLFNQLAGEPLTARLQNGYRVPVDPADFSGRQLYLFGTNQPAIIAVCKALLQPGDVFFDVGANYGSVGLLCSERVEPGGAVHLFEPQPRLGQSIQACIDRHMLRHIHLHQIGLLDRDAILELEVPEHHTGRASFVRDLYQAKWAEQVKTIQVPVRNAAACLPALAGSRRFGVKLDVEGAERLILPCLVRLPRLRFVVFENHARNQLDREGKSAEIWETLQTAELLVAGIPFFERRPRLVPVSCREQMIQFPDLAAVSRQDAALFDQLAQPRRPEEAALERRPTR